MSAKATQAEAEIGAENDQSDIEAAKETVQQALRELDMTEHREQWFELQRRFFDLEAARLARDDEFQEMELDGTRLNVPSSHAIVGDNPTAQDEHGEVELPTRDESFRVLDAVQVADPENPHTTHRVSVDHVIETDGEVRLEVNALTLDEVGKKQGSHIR